MRKMVFLLALALGLHLQAQELDVCTKPYGEEQEIVVIKPTVANFLTLLSLTEEQFQNVMEESTANAQVLCRAAYELFVRQPSLKQPVRSARKPSAERPC